MIMVFDKKTDIPELSAGLRELFARKNWSLLWQTYTLGREWPEIVGKDIAKKSEPAYIQRDTLWVYVQSSVLMQHLQSQKPALLEKINRMMPNAGIQDIRWAMQPARPPITEKKSVKDLPSRTPVDPEERDAFAALTSTVQDKECREALQRLWRKCHDR